MESDSITLFQEGNQVDLRLVRKILDGYIESKYTISKCGSLEKFCVGSFDKRKDNKEFSNLSMLVPSSKSLSIDGNNSEEQLFSFVETIESSGILSGEYKFLGFFVSAGQEKESILLDPASFPDLHKFYFRIVMARGKDLCKIDIPCFIQRDGNFLNINADIDYLTSEIRRLPVEERVVEFVSKQLFGVSRWGSTKG